MIPGKADSLNVLLPPRPQTGKRKRGACSAHFQSVSDRFTTTLKKVGCICAGLIAQNLEPCCNVGWPVSTLSTITAARKTSSSSIPKLTLDVSDRTKEEIYTADNVKGSSKMSELYSPKKAPSSTVVSKDSYYYANEKGELCETREGGCRTNISNNQCSSREIELDCSITRKKSPGGFEKNQCCVPKQKICSTTKKDNCSGAVKEQCCSMEEDTSSNVKEDGGCGAVQKQCCSVEDDISSHVKEDSCCGAVKEQCCSLEEDVPSYAKEDGCRDYENPKAISSFGKSCFTRAYIRTDGAEPVGASCCDSGISESKGWSKDASYDNSDFCFKKGVSSSDKLDEKVSNNLDIEKGALALQHVVLDVQGLTCVGCETKLFRSLRDIPGMHNLHTSLVLSQAEFDLDEKAGPVPEIIKSVEKNTGFTCQQLSSQGQDIDVVVDGDAKAFVERKYPDGVTQMMAIDKRTVRITYDANIIGARALIENCFDSPLELSAPRGSSELESGKKHVRSTAWITLVSAILTIPVLILGWAPLPPRPIAYGGTSLALATIVQIVVAGPFYPSALKALVFTRVIEMDLLIVLSTSTAYIFSIISFAYQVVGHPLLTGEFFEISTLLVTLIMVGRLASAFARQRAVESVSIRSLQTQTAVLCDADGLGNREIDARLLQYGDCFKVTPGSRITTDGIITTGITEVDESMVTGESLPIEKHPSSSVIAGSLNCSGIIVVRLKHLPSENTINTIAAMVDEAKFSKPKTQELVDVVAGYFVPVILIFTIITFIIWITIGISVRHQNAGHAAVNALTYAISVLIVSCPCAIGLAVPMVIVISGGVSAKHGIIVKSAMAIETGRKVSHVVFDKTGTLTHGQMSVVEEIYPSDKQGNSGSITLGLTCNNKHPVSVAISAYLKDKGIEAANVKDSKSIGGKGIEGALNGIKIRCGNSRWLSVETFPDIQALLSKGLTVFGVVMNEQLIAAFGLSDTLRPDSHYVITQLQKRNIPVSIVSGDDTGAVEFVAANLGIPTTHVRSRCMPSDKQEYLKNLMTDGKKIVVFCGDGTNDALALTQANIGVHLNSGSDVAQSAANVILVRPRLGGILVLLDLSKAASHRIFFNFAWSFVYNLFAILLAAGAFVDARIPPQYAGLGEIVSVLPVILIALQLKWFKREY
ncbi:hypothetical protein MMC14_001543 [Varicellaria rhodocarpa]|nr:hypothetical protein [Varicellaria rhodocarpa]